MNRFVVFLIIVMLAACQPAATMSPAKQSVSNAPNAYPEAGMAPVEDAHFRVERVAVFEDKMAYGNRRAIYIITDKKTERQYIGLSGIGITEIGSHSCGKYCTTEDER